MTQPSDPSAPPPNPPASRRKRSAPGTSPNPVTYVASLPEGKITEREDAFCRAYIACLKTGEAARRAGYSDHKAGTDLMAKPKIRAHIAQLQAQLAQKTSVDAEFIIGALVQNHIAAKADGKFKDSNDALKMLGEHLGLFSGQALQRPVGALSASNKPEDVKRDIDALNRVLGPAPKPPAADEPAKPH